MTQNAEIDYELYTSIKEAKEEIWHRWNNNALRHEVETFLGEVPPVLKKEPKAVLFRHVMCLGIGVGPS